MPRHLISDAHEWINEIPTGPTHLSPPQIEPSPRTAHALPTHVLFCIRWFQTE